MPDIECIDLKWYSSHKLGPRGERDHFRSECPLGPEAVVLSTWSSKRLSVDQYILYLAFKSFTPYHSICSYHNLKAPPIKHQGFTVLVLTVNFYYEWLQKQHILYNYAS